MTKSTKNNDEINVSVSNKKNTLKQSQKSFSRASIILLLALVTMVNILATRYMLKNSNNSSDILMLTNKVNDKSQVRIVDFEYIVTKLEGSSPQEMSKYIDLTIQLAAKRGYILIDAKNAIGYSPQDVLKFIKKEKLFSIAKKEGVKPLRMKNSGAELLRLN